MELGEVVGFKRTMSGDLLALGGLSCLVLVVLWAKVLFREVGQPVKEKGATPVHAALYASVGFGSMTVAVVAAVSSLSLLAPGMVVVFTDTGGVWHALALPVMAGGLAAIVYGVPLSVVVGGAVTGLGYLWPRYCGAIGGTAVGFVGGIAGVFTTFPVWWCGNSTLQEVAFLTTTTFTALVCGGMAAGAAAAWTLERGHARGSGRVAAEQGVAADNPQESQR